MLAQSINVSDERTDRRITTGIPRSA